MAWIHFEIFSYIIWCFIITHAIYSTGKSISFKLETWLQKRNIVIYYALNISCITTIISFLGFAICLIHGSSLMITATTICWTTAVFIWICIIAIKNWMIYFQHKWTFYIKQSKWQQIINPRIVDTLSRQNWFIRNHQTYGQFKYVYRLLGTIAILCCIVSGLTWSLTFHLIDNFPTHIAISGAITLFIYTPWIALYLFCVLKTPAFDDAFNVHRESRMHAKLLLLTIPSPTISVIYATITGDMAVAFFMTCFTGSIIIYSIVIVSTVYIAKQMHNKKHEWQIADDGITLQKVLSNETTLNLFMNYLSTEYSMEILLSCIEMLQYQNYVRNLMDRHFCTFSPTRCLTGILISEIIEGSEKEMEVEIDKMDAAECLEKAKIKAHKLYNKYVKVESEFEINISGDMRYALRSKLEHLDKLLLDTSTDLKELHMIFEDAKQEMMTLQSISFERFRAEPEFDAVKAMFNVKTKKATAIAVI